MAAPCYITWNGATSALTGPLAGVATSATSGTVKTMLQIKPGASKIRIIEWGYSFESTPAAPVRMELIETGTVFATVTAATAVTAYNDVTGPASLTSLGTAATGYTATAEGTITATRLLAYQEETSTAFKQQFPLGREPEVNAASALRIRATPTSAASVNVTCYLIWEE
ncbi:hypothetical protein ACFORO_12645 [Amycolatopsis halotolerans]|uniref:Uncharacterized protein n=1 Tax=Amycolatopsis halotolerans TaxID=330083 RepID=A0ABV7QCK7_9PSEU